MEDDEGKGLPDEYISFIIMRTMGWDWYTFSTQPNSIIELITSFIIAEKNAKVDRRGNNNG